MTSTLPPEVDARIVSTGRWFWNRTLRHRTTVQLDDVLQFCRLQFLEKPTTNPKFVSSRVRWLILSEFIQRDKRPKWHEHAGIPFGEPTAWDSHGTGHQKAAADFQLAGLSTVSAEARERLLENLWAVGNPRIYQSLVAYSEGVPMAGAASARAVGHVEFSDISRGAAVLQRAYGTLGALVGQGRAQYFPAAALKALRVYAVRVGSAAFPLTKNHRFTLKAYLTYDAQTKTHALTDEGHAYVNSFPPERLAFLARQL